MDASELDRHWAAGLTFGELPRGAARRFGDREALAFRGRRYSFRQIAAEVDHLARGLIHIGIAPGENVCLWLNNCPEWIFAMFALARIGAVHVPVNTRFRTTDLEYVLTQSEATALITHDVSGPVDYLAMARELFTAPVEPGDRLVRSAVSPSMRRLVIKSDHRHAGAFSWADVLEGGAARGRLGALGAGRGREAHRHRAHHVHVGNDGLPQGRDARPHPASEPPRSPPHSRHHGARRHRQLPAPLPHLRLRRRAALHPARRLPPGAHRDLRSRRDPRPRRARGRPRSSTASRPT